MENPGGYILIDANRIKVTSSSTGSFTDHDLAEIMKSPKRKYFYGGSLNLGSATFTDTMYSITFQAKQSDGSYFFSVIAGPYILSLNLAGDVFEYSITRGN